MEKERNHNSGQDRCPAWLDILQGLSGLLLVVFIGVHSILLSSILISHDAMYTVARFFEGTPLFGKPYPLLVSFIATVVFLLVILHALTAIRKIPASYRQYNAFYKHMRSFKHSDTTLWLVQVVTGFVIMFLIGAHIYQMISEPDGIGPYASADRIWSDHVWVLYLLLLLSAEIHAGVGVYRLILKWGLLGQQQTKQQRMRLRRFIVILVLAFITLGLATLTTEMFIGYQHADRVGERYIPMSESR